MKHKFYCIVTVLFFLIADATRAQTGQDLYDLSLEELMKIPIKSASKKEETLFDAPLSSYTITRAEIDKAGSTSIMEALRLAPGVIVREQANGVYDIHIRGMEDLTRNNYDFFKPNAYTLVMIDNRPVFNHGLGGTFWESLPVDINDVDRIEIVRGPSSPLFGPNAVTGVINIITKRLDKNNTLVTANVQRGTNGTTIANVSAGKNITDKFGVLISANYQDRQRVDQNYYKDSTGTYAPLATIIPDAATRNFRYPHPSRALNKWGVNANLNYKFSSHILADLTLSKQMASSQRIFASNPLSYSNTDNTAANLALNVYNLKVRTSYLDGYNSDNRTYAPSPNGEYNYKIADAVAEYDFKIGDHYTITPGVSYQHVSFDDRSYIKENMLGYYNASRTITTAAGFLRSDLNFNKLRVIAGLRADKFSVPDKIYLAYELASTFKINDKNLVRAAVTRSNSGSFIGYNYVNVNSPYTGSFIGDNNLKLLTINMIELGYRMQISKMLQVDLDIFQQKATNLTAIVVKSLPPFAPNLVAQFSNVPVTATQRGATLSLNFVPNDKIQFKPFVTFQKTETRNLPSLYIDPGAVPFPITYTNSTHKYTPASYGGFYLNYKPFAKFNVNLSGYYFTKQSQYDPSWSEQNKTTLQYAQGQIAGKMMLNAKVSYEIVKGLLIYVNGRNFLNANSREFYGADRASSLYLAGVSYNFNK